MANGPFADVPKVDLQNGPPAPEDGWIAKVDHEHKALLVTSESYRACNVCGAEFRAEEPHTRAIL